MASLQYKTSELWADSKLLARDIEMTLSHGKIYGLLGDNGAGKSTLMSEIAKYARKQTKINWSIGVMEQQIEPNPGDTIVETVFMYSAPDLYAYNKVRDDKFSEELDARYLEQQREIIRTLTGLGFRNMSSISVTYSGGWKQRLRLAATIYHKPDLLMLDEPTNNLDLEAAVWLSNYIAKYYKNTDRCALIITHDIDMLDGTCSGYYEIAHQKVTLYKNSFSQYLVDRELRNPGLNDAIIRQLRSIKTARTDPDIVFATVNRIMDRKFTFQYSGTATARGKPAIRLSEFRFKYRGTPDFLFYNLDVAINHGERFYLVGRNGTGKTTLLNKIAGTLPEDKVEVNTVSELNGHFIKGRVNYFRQSSIDALEAHRGKTVEQYVFEGMSKATGDALVGGLIGKFRDRPIDKLSGGENCRVALARMALTPCEILILDEPTNHLDVDGIAMLNHAIREFPGTVIMVTHDIRILQNVEVESLAKAPPTMTFVRMPFLQYYNDTLKYLARLEQEAIEATAAGRKRPVTAAVKTADPAIELERAVAEWIRKNQL